MRDKGQRRPRRWWCRCCLTDVSLSILSSSSAFCVLFLVTYLLPLDTLILPSKLRYVTILYAIIRLSWFLLKPRKQTKTVRNKLLPLFQAFSICCVVFVMYKSLKWCSHNIEFLRRRRRKVRHFLYRHNLRYVGDVTLEDQFGQKLDMYAKFR